MILLERGLTLATPRMAASLTNLACSMRHFSICPLAKRNKRIRCRGSHWSRHTKLLRGQGTLPIEQLPQTCTELGPSMDRPVMITVKSIRLRKSVLTSSQAGVVRLALGALIISSNSRDRALVLIPRVHQAWQQYRSAVLPSPSRRDKNDC